MRKTRCTLHRHSLGEENFMSQRALLLLVVIWLALGALAATAVGADARVILEANVHGFGMTGFAGEHLYLRVREDGGIEFGDLRGRNKPDVLRTSKLSPPQLQSLVTFLSSPGVRSLAPLVPTPAQMTDSNEVVTLVITTGRDQPQKIEIQNYFPPAAKKSFYPPALSELMCRMEELRKHASLRLVQKDWCKAR
jgi:hypothetical protein